MRAMFFVEGRFRLTNQMLSDLRAAGHFEGEAAALRRQGGWRGRKSPGYDLFASETQAIRLATKASAKNIGAVPDVVNVALWVLGHHKHDPDAWLLLGKAIIDGLKDAGLIRSDRFQVGVVAGRVVRSTAEEFSVRRYYEEETGSRLPDCSGVVVGLDEAEATVGVCRD